MADDREILRETWDGKIPICFKLATEEIYTIQQPDPYYLMVPRMSYFPLVMEKVRKHLQMYSPEDVKESDMWLELESGQPLKWHYPIGLLYDLHQADTPWMLNVHFKSYPKAELLPDCSRASVESVYMSAVKEADALKHRGNVINSMQKKDHNQLWMGLQNDKFDQFWAINKKLMEHMSDEPFKYIPFRIYQKPGEPYTQSLIKPFLDNGEPATIADLLTAMLNSDCSHKVILHGIELPLDAPLLWLSEHLSYPDNFLHLCVFSES